MARVSMNHISSNQLRATYQMFVRFIDQAERTLFSSFNDNRYLEFKEKMLVQFNNWLDEKIENLDSFLIQSEKDITFLKFSASINRAFSVGFHGISKEIEKAKSTRRKDKPNLKGIERRTKKGGQFNLGLVKYIKLIIIITQADFIRSIQKMRSIENGLDLVRIDSHFSKTGRSRTLPCNIWKDRIVSIIGVDVTFPTIAQITRQGMFHPHCSHGITPLTQKETEVALTTGIKTYSALKNRL